MSEIRNLLNTIAIIPDGNRRYAKKEGLSIKDVYWQSSGRVNELINWAKKRNIDNLVIWVLSTDNFKKRSLKEKRILFDIFYKRAEQYLKNKIQGINVYFIGQIYKLPNKLKRIFNEVEIEYNNIINPLKIYLLVNYSGEVELLSAFNNRKNKIKDLRNGLWLKEDIDLIIRTGGEKRLSNFAIYQSRYAELFFIDKLFPEVSIKEFDDSINYFNSINRKFGK